MLPDWVSNPGPLTYASGALPIALRGPATAADRKLERLFPFWKNLEHPFILIFVMVEIFSVQELRKLSRLRVALLI